MNASTLLQTIVATHKERAFKQAVAPLLAGKQQLVAHAACRFALDEETLQPGVSYTPAVQGVLDYYEREIERIRQKHFGKRPSRSFAPFAPRPHVQL